MNTKIINITVRSVIILMSALSIVFTIGILLNFTELKVDSPIAETWLNPFVILTFIALGIAAFFSVIFPIADMVANPKKGLMALGVLIAFGILFAISYSFATGETDASFYKEFNIDSTWSRLIGASIYLTYIMCALSVFSLVITWIMKFFKN